MTAKVHPDLSNAELNSFGISAEDLALLSDKYLTRTQREDVDYLVEIGGPEDLQVKLHTDLRNGLSDSDNSDDRVEWFGSNARDEVVRRSYCQIVWEALEDTTLRILSAAGLVSLVLGLSLDEHPEYGWIDGFAILVAVLIVTQVTAINDYQKEKKFAKLQEEHSNRKAVTLLREGARIRRHPDDVMVGDLVEVTAGMTIPADGILLVCNQVETMEAAMTGESDSLKKLSASEALSSAETPGSPVVLSGTSVSQGLGVMLVTAVGPLSAEGKIIDLAEQEDEETPLQQKLSKLADAIGKAGLCCAVVAVFVLFLRFLVTLLSGDEIWDSGKHPKELVGYFIIGVTIVVVAIPEGLPLAVTISLAYSVKKMQKDNNLVRRMQACETMGGADCICSDKTGTLTQNKMTVVRLNLADQSYNLENTPESLRTFPKVPKEILTEGIATNSTAYINADGEEVGSKTEIALVRMLLKSGKDDYLQIRKDYGARQYSLFPFDSKRKVSSAVVTPRNSSDRRIHIKGAAEVIISRCDYICSSEGTLKPLTDEVREKLKADMRQMAQQSLRTICLAYLDAKPDKISLKVDNKGVPEVEKLRFVLLAMAGLKDPIRPEVPEAVKMCQMAGITVRMVTGDSEQTAQAVAIECNIITEDLPGVILTGKDFAARTGGTVCKNCRDLQDCQCVRDSRKAKSGEQVREDVVKEIGAFSDIVVNLRVLARSRPEDKYTLVTGLRQLGHVVAVTGDGTNDAPALKKADVGFAMGISGTEMAKEAASIILLDDNFASVVKAVKWGRNIYDNIRCFLQFQLTVNVVAVTCAVVGACSIEQSPLTAVQMLWVNLIMDTLASLSLATEPPTDEHLKRQPQGRTESIVSPTMWKHIFGQAVLQLAIIFLMMFYGENFLPEYGDGELYPRNPTNTDFVRSGRLYTIGGHEDYEPYYKDPDIGPSRHFTYIFNTFVLLQLFNELNCRKLSSDVNIFKGAFHNGMFWGLWVFTLAAQVVLVQIGSVALSVHKDGLTVQQWLICIGFAVLPLGWRVLLVHFPDLAEVSRLQYSIPKRSYDGLLDAAPKRRSPRHLCPKVVCAD